MSNGDGDSSYVILNSRRRKIFIRGEINFGTSASFAVQLDRLSLQGKPVSIDITSSGGDTISSLDIYNKIRHAAFPITTATFGGILSGGLLIFLGGERRLVSRQSLIKFHWPIMSREHDEELNPDSTKTDADFFDKVFQHYGFIISERTGLPIKKVIDYMRYSKTFTGEEAVKMGIATGFLKERGR